MRGIKIRRKLGCRLPTRSFTFRSHLRDELEAVYVIAPLYVLRAVLDGAKQAGSLLGIELVIHEHQLDLGSLRQIGGWIIEDELPISHVSLERLHRLEVYTPSSLAATGEIAEASWV